MPAFSPRGLRTAGLAVIIVAFLVVAPRSWFFRLDTAPIGGEAGAGSRWACPMYCVIMDVRPRDERCPVCGMTLGRVAVESALDRHERGMIGLEVARLEAVPLEKELLLTGEVDFDESRISVITARTAGFIERMPKKVTWDAVTEGEILFEIYSPEVYAAEQEYLVARTSGVETVLTAARERLANLGLRQEEIAALEAAARPSRSVPYRAPRSGLIVRRGADEGAHVAAGLEVFVLADLSHVWLQLEAFETDLAWLDRGTMVDVATATDRAVKHRGRIVFIDPVVDRTTRTARVRVEVQNPVLDGRTGALMPGQRVACTARIALGADGRHRAADEAAAPILAAPRSAVLSTGRRNVLYVLHADETRQIDGRTELVRRRDLDPKNLPALVGYELVEVELGPLAQRADEAAMTEYYPIRGLVPRRDEGALTELTPGLLIAVKGALLLDSQAQISGRPSLLFPEGRIAMRAADGR